MGKTYKALFCNILILGGFMMPSISMVIDAQVSPDHYCEQWSLPVLSKPKIGQKVNKEIIQFGHLGIRVTEAADIPGDQIQNMNIYQFQDDSENI